ncbi:uracil phosphoribosyltransferase [Bacteroidales bacterium OttesenSCG-928-B11]|nr:uracil phosphoribosyltransferase [Bacteroidales bacterium OttesenSCG-928-E04]MDL2308094.1 uracil phosphoribosyltransferase [Bacteroidales bacterium OttesenSCG-928-C03]MDL2311618.1 uracil phosphoribosyltransferase [Bacteroidales bacterium OttesenSCG-928-B11]
MKSVRYLGQENSLFNTFISELRSAEIQKDSMRFRRNLERIGEIFAYEISKELEVADQEIVTPLGIANMKLIQERPVLATILRAGLPLHQGFLNYFDDADNAFISAYRKHYRDGSFEIQVDYMSAPQLDDRILIISDPMLATGKSMFLAYQELLANGVPKHTHLVSSIASVQGVEYLQSKLSPVNCTIWVGAVDEELTAQSYIVPGLGDAGDLAYGYKTSE